MKHTYCAVVAARKDWLDDETFTTIFRWKRKNVGQKLAL